MAREDLHVVANSGGQLFHSIRRSSGSWTPLADVEFHTGDAGELRDVAVATDGPALHVAAINSVGQVLHGVRSANGRWSPLGDVEHHASRIGDLRHVALAAVGPEVHLAAIDDRGQLWHAIRFANGRWTPFGTRGAPGRSRRTSEVTVTGIGLELHVAATDNRGVVWHAIRFGRTGSWTDFGNVEATLAGDIGVARKVSATAMGSDLHLAATNAEGRLFRTTRRADGSWTSFVDIERDAGVRPEPRGGVAMAAVGRDLHLTTITSDSRLSHAIRFSDGSWTPFGDVEDGTGRRVGTMRTAAMAAERG